VRGRDGDIAEWAWSCDKRSGAGQWARPNAINFFEIFFPIEICKMTNEPFVNSKIHHNLRDGRLNKKKQLSFWDEI
jgi:hypothetical protein